MLNRVGEIANLRKGRATQRVVVVNGSQEMLELLESVLDAGHYDMVFVSDTEHAYSQIKQNRPQLRSAPFQAHLRTVLLSNVEDVDHSYTLGADFGEVDRQA